MTVFCYEDLVKDLLIIGFYSNAPLPLPCVHASLRHVEICLMKQN